MYINISSGKVTYPLGAHVADMQDKAVPFHQAQYGGMGVEEVYGPGVYFIGLIDILQQVHLVIDTYRYLPTCASIYIYILLVVNGAFDYEVVSV
jgi:hypothetical protein